MKSWREKKWGDYDMEEEEEEDCDKEVLVPSNNNNSPMSSLLPSHVLTLPLLHIEKVQVQQSQQQQQLPKLCYVDDTTILKNAVAEFFLALRDRALNSCLQLHEITPEHVSCIIEQQRNLITFVVQRITLQMQLYDLVALNYTFLFARFLNYFGRETKCSVMVNHKISLIVASYVHEEKPPILMFS